MAQAQLAPVEYQLGGDDGKSKDWKAELAESRFLKPGVLWWAFDWDSADRHEYFRPFAKPEKPERSEEDPPACSAVVLIDEIDKADPSVPNGLLEALGNEGFETPLLGGPVKQAGKTAPGHYHHER